MDAAPGKQLRAMMAHLRPVEVSRDRILVACDDAPLRKMVESRLADIEGIVRQLSPAARLELAPLGTQGQATETAAAISPPPANTDEPEIVRIAAELFSARVVNVQRKDRINGNG